MTTVLERKTFQSTPVTNEGESAARRAWLLLARAHGTPMQRLAADRLQERMNLLCHTLRKGQTTPLRFLRTAADGGGYVGATAARFAAAVSC
jgi:hypothetical protein